MRQARYWLTVIPASAVAAWIAALLVPAYHVDGAPAVQCLTFLLTGAVFALVFRFLPWPAHRALRPLERRAARLLRDEDAAFDAETEWEFFAPIRFAWLVGALQWLVGLVATIVVPPVAFWLGTMLVIALGLPAHLDGFWPTVVAGLIVRAVRGWLAQPERWLTGPRKLIRAARSAAQLLLPLGGITAAVAVVDGVDLDPASWTRQLLTLAVLTTLFLLVTLYVAAPFVTTLLRIAGNGLKLWSVAWLSTWMDPSLRIDGWWPFLLAAAIVTTATWFLRLTHPPSPPPPPPMPDPFWSDPFGPHYHFPLR
ncbi:hypothetical protein ABZ897_19315 [Nonomuraea sp. NPDC046802]|uniref:hypothetical protein n=1 Tax=Nonomuraea sp. NPDC046802 TaxID=3154919 RepID=UPI0033F4F2B6